MNIHVLIRQVISTGILLSHVIVLLFVLIYLAERLFSTRTQIAKKIISYIRRKYILISLVISASSILGSLFFSEILRYPPCELCWYQRFFMYPQFVILLIALSKKYKHIFMYVIPLNIFGLLIAIYHLLISTFLKSTTSVCSATAVSCSIEYFKDYQYITIPIMSLTSFFLLLLVSIIAIKKES